MPPRSGNQVGIRAHDSGLRVDLDGTGRRLSDHVAAALLERVTSGEYSAGDRLPPEREMATRFGVSRTVIREATKALASRGIVEVRPGAGIFATSAHASAAAESLRLLVLGAADLSYEQVHEVRETLEGRIAALAAVRSTESDLDHLRDRLADLDNAITGEAYARADGAFHLVIADLAGNPLFRIILEAVGDVMLEVRRRVAYVPEARRRVTADHRRIAAAIERGDAEEARVEMEQHLAHSLAIVLELDRSVRSARSRSSAPVRNRLVQSDGVLD